MSIIKDDEMQKVAEGLLLVQAWAGCFAYPNTCKQVIRAQHVTLWHRSISSQRKPVQPHLG